MVAHKKKEGRVKKNPNKADPIQTSGTRGRRVFTQHRDQREDLIPSTKSGPVYETKLDKFYSSNKASSKELCLPSTALSRN